MDQIAIPLLSSFTAFSFSMISSSLYSEPFGSPVVLIIERIQRERKIWVGL